jgi:hypothetical protein
MQEMVLEFLMFSLLISWLAQMSNHHADYDYFTPQIKDVKCHLQVHFMG